MPPYNTRQALWSSQASTSQQLPFQVQLQQLRLLQRQLQSQQHQQYEQNQQVQLQDHRNQPEAVPQNPVLEESLQTLTVPQSSMDNAYYSPPGYASSGSRPSAYDPAVYGAPMYDPFIYEPFVSVSSSTMNQDQQPQRPQQHASLDPSSGIYSISTDIDSGSYASPALAEVCDIASMPVELEALPSGLHMPDPSGYNPLACFFGSMEAEPSWPVPCAHPDCLSAPLKRSADVVRHLNATHVPSYKKDTYHCDHPECPRARDPFHRRDHYREHLRDYHKEDIDKRNTEAPHPEWFLSRRLDPTWWRCVRCLRRILVERHGYQCPRCKIPCTAWRQLRRQRGQ